ncbi:MAG: adenylate kinase [Hydrogenophilales bacterium]
MKIVLLGSPGSGKGTQANFITENYNLPQISTGDMLRQAISSGDEIGIKAQTFMQSGKLVPDEIIIDLVKQRIKSDDCANGFLFDGYPRNMSQAISLKNSGIKLTHIIQIDVADDEILKRLTGRRVHLPSGRTYHINFNPPKNEGLDDLTNEKLVQREDDTEETIKKRLAVYHSDTEPLINYYKNLATNNNELFFSKINGLNSVENIKDEISSFLMNK